jgi:hypothetical protein
MIERSLIKIQKNKYDKFFLCNANIINANVTHLITGSHTSNACHLGEKNPIKCKKESIIILDDILEKIKYCKMQKILIKH